MLLLPDSQKLFSDFLEFFGRGRVGLNQLEEYSHDVHANEGEELLLVDALAGANVDASIGGSVFFFKANQTNIKDKVDFMLPISCECLFKSYSFEKSLQVC